MATGESRSVLLWGGTGQAKVLREALQDNGWIVVAVVDNDPDCAPPFPNIPLLRGWPELKRWRERKQLPADCLAAVAIGGDKGRERVQLQRELADQGIAALTVVHPHAVVSNTARLGAGCQVLANATVCTEASLGEACIVNTAASIDHECHLGDGVHIGPGARLAGLVNVAAYATIYTGAIVAPRIEIGEGAIVGAGAVVLADVDPYVVVVGNPARPIRNLARSAHG